MIMSEDSARKLRRFRLEAKSIVQISLGIAGLALVFVILLSRIGLVHRQASADASSKVNALGCQVLLFIDSTVDRSAKALNATEHAPSASPDQKLTAARNLVGLKIVQHDAHAKLAKAHIICKKTTISTQRIKDTPTSVISSTPTRASTPSS